jgi:hypothetical protein
MKPWLSVGADTRHVETDLTRAPHGNAPHPWRTTRHPLKRLDRRVVERHAVQAQEL